MKHGSLISPDESAFGFGSSNAVSVTPSATRGDAADFITVPDAHLLFNGEFKRSGDDLKIVGDDGTSFLVTDYFKNDKRPTLLSPEGAALMPNVVSALAGPLAPGQYAQAGTPQSTGQAIGRVEKVEGNATVVRNGVTITLNAGDVIHKGDVAQTGANSSLAIVFADGTAFNLASGARMVLNDFVYSAGGSNNSALISLVQGSISFVAGQVAKTGDMRVDTPVATMGIRGTAVLIEINANNGQTKFSVMLEPSGITGVATLHQINADGTRGPLIGTVNNSAFGWIVTPAGPAQVIAQQIQKSPAELAMELAVVQQVFQTFNAGQNNPFDPGAPQQTPTDPNRRGDNPDPQNTNTANGSSTIPDTGTITVTVTPTPPATGGNTTTTTNTNTATGTDTSGTSGIGDPSPGETEPTTTTFASNQLTGTDEADTFGPEDADFITTAGADVIVALGGNDIIETGDGDDVVNAGDGDDTIIAAHGGGNDFYDGGANSEEGDTILFTSAEQGVELHLNQETVNGVKVSHAIGIGIGLDIIVDVENFVGSSQNDVFHLYDGSHWTLDGGGGFDIIKLTGGLDFTGEGEENDGPDVYNIEMVDLDDGEVNVIDFDGDGVDDFNEAGVVRVIGNDGDVINLGDDDGDQNGHWVLVGNPQIDAAGDEGLFSDDHHTDGVEFQRYDFVEDGHVTSTAYIDTVILVNVVNLGELAAQDDTAGMTENQVLFVDALANDSDGGSSPTTLTSVGTISIDGPDNVTLGPAAIVIENNKIRITPGTAFDALAAGETATITIPYTMQNGDGETASAIATVTVTGTNDAPSFSTFPQGFETIGSVEGDSSFGGTPAVRLITNGANSSEIETFLGLSAGALVLISQQNTQPGALLQPTNGAAIAFDLDLAAGETVTFTWNFASTEYEPFADFAFFSFAPAFGDKLADIFAIGDSINDDVLHSSGWQQYSFTAEDAGQYRLGIGAVNTGDILFDSLLYISGFTGLGFARQTTEDGTLETFDLLNGAFDVDTNDILVATNIDNVAYNQDGETVDVPGAIQVVANTVTIDPTFFNYLAAGESVTVTVNYDISDGHTATHNSATLVVNGENDAPQNDAPVISIDNAYATEAGDSTSTTLVGVSVSDVDNGGDDVFEATVVAQHGTLSMADEDLNEFDDDPSGSGMSFHATLSEITDALQLGVTYTNPAYAAGLTDKVTLSIQDENGGSDAINFIFNVFGDSDVALSATEGKDVLFGTGYADTFVFRPNMNHDTIINFTPGTDLIDLGIAGDFASVPTIEGVLDFEGWIATAGAFETITHGTETTTDDDTLIHFSDNDDLLLKNVIVGNLSANDFIISPGIIGGQ